MMGDSSEDLINDSDQRLADQLGKIADEMADRLADHQRVELSDYIKRYPELADMLPGIYSSVRGLSSWLDSDDSSADSAENLSLGDFRLSREIGRGGMGIVYEAEQLSLRRPVAVKVFPFASVLEPNKLQRFKNEALAAATLDHPHIVPVLAVGVERGTHFYAMRLIQGTSLANAIREFHSESHRVGPQPKRRGFADKASDANGDRGETLGIVQDSTLDSRSSNERSQYQKQVATWIRDVAEALHYAHSLGIVHRDVKPANLLIDDQQKVWVTDFGLATGVIEATMTLTGDLLGTLPYMSPEQVSGKRQLVDERTDIYSLGVTLYEALSGQKPFVTDNRSELIQLIGNTEPRIPSPTQRLLSSDLVNVTLKAMAKDPRERYGTAKELADDLSRFLDGKPVVARRPSVLDRSIRWVKRNRTVSVATAIVFACLAFATTNSQLSSLRIRKTSAELNHHLYVADVSLAAEALEQQNVVQARELLSHHIPQAGDRDLRGFAWHFLWNKVNPAEQSFDAHNLAVSSIDWSPDGKEILSASGDGRIFAWDPENGNILRRMPKWPTPVSCLRYTPAGDRVAIVDTDGKLAILNSVSGEVLASINAHIGDVAVVSFSADGALIATAGLDDGRIRAFDAATLERKFDVASHGQVNSVAFYDGGKRLASSGSDKRIRLWELGSTEPIKEFSLTTSDRIRGIAISPDGESLVANVGRGQLRKYVLPKFTEPTEWNISGDRFYEVQFSPDGRYVVACGKDRLTRIVDVNTGEVLRTLAGHDRRVFAASFSPDGAKVATASADATCLVYDISKKNDEVLYQNDDVVGTTAAVSNDGRWLTFENGRGDWYVRDNSSGEVKLLPGTHLESNRLSASYSADGSLLATTGGPVISWGATRATEISSSSEPFSMDLDFDGDLDRVTMIAPHGRLIWQKQVEGGKFSAVRILPIRDSRIAQAQIQVDGNGSWESVGMTTWTFQSFIGSEGNIERTWPRLSPVDAKLLCIENESNKQFMIRAVNHEFLELHTNHDGQPNSVTKLPISAAGPMLIVSADIDADDNEDLVVVRPQHGTLEWYSRSGAEEFASRGVIIDSLVQPKIVFAEDIDEDGLPDLVTSDGGQVVWLRSFRGDGFASPQPLEKPLQKLKAAISPLANVAVWDTTSGELTATLLPLEHNPRSVALSPAGKLVATCGDGGHVRIRERDSGDQLAVIEVPDDPQLESLEFSPDGKKLAICHGDDCLLWNVADGMLDATLRGHESTVQRAVFSNDGKLLATLSNDFTIALWNALTGRRLRTIYGFNDRTRCACFAPDDQTLVVGTRNGALYLFDVESGQKLCTVARFGGAGVEAVCFPGEHELLAVIIDNRSRMLQLMSFEAVGG